MSEGTGRQNITNSVLEITVSFLGIHKWEPVICIELYRPFLAVYEHKLMVRSRKLP
jgi:hypothetical protein